MLSPLNTHQLDTWHLPTVDAQKLLLSLALAYRARLLETLLRVEQADTAYIAGEVKDATAAVDWLETVPTRNDA